MFLLVAFAAIIMFSCQNLTNEPTVKSDFSNQLTEDEKTGGIMTPEILWKFGRIGGFDVSPDGNTIAFSITRYDAKTNKSNTNIFTIPATGGEHVMLTTFDQSDFSPVWVNDGKQIAYMSTSGGSVQVWKMNADGSMKTKVSDINGGINAFRFSPDESKVFYTADVKMEETVNEKYVDLPLANARIMNDLMYRHWNDWSDYKFSHIFISDVKDGKFSVGKDILEGELWDAPLAPYFDDAEINWSPDGKTIAYTCKKLYGREYAVSTNSDIYLYDLETGKTKNITEGMSGYDKYPVYSPDGSKIAWMSMKKPGYESDQERLFVIDLATGEKMQLNDNWDQNASSYEWSDDGTEIYFISSINATFQLYKVNVASKEFTQITKGHHNYNSFKKVGELLIGAKVKQSMAAELFAANSVSGEETQITHVNQNIYDHIKMGKSVERWVTTTDGKKMLVWMILPPNFDETKKYPALLYCQGGPQSPVSQFWSYRWNFQMMVANDYIIVAPNRRGVPSFGQEWNEQISGDYSGQNIKDYLSAIDELKKEPFIDENRLGSVGASYGGYSVFYLAGHHDGRFKAFISHCGMFNFESFYAATEETFFPNQDLGGAYWDTKNKVAQKSYANSPHKAVQNWDTPIMIITGGKDFRIPYTESLQAFNAAQLQGIPSRLLYFPEETHFVVKPQNSILWQREFFGWLDTYLK